MAARTEQHHVKVSSIVGPMVIFESALRNRFQLALAQIHRDDGSMANWQDLQVGLDAVIISIPHSNTVSATLDYKPMWKRFNFAVHLYSSEIFSIVVLKRAYGYAIQALEIIEQKCVSLRNCNGIIESDNYFWRTFSVAYLEHLLRRSTPITELHHFQAYLKDIDPRQDSIILQKLLELERAKADDKLRSRWIGTENENIEFWREMEEFVKKLFGHYIKKYGATLPYIAGMDPEHVMTFVLKEQWQSEIILRVMAEALDLKIIIYYPNLTKWKDTYEPKEVGKRVAYLYLFNDGDMYHTLYSQAQMDADHRPIDPSLLYHTVTPRYQLPSGLGVELDETRTKIEKMAKFNIVFEDVFRHLIGFVGRQPANQFFDEDLGMQTMLMVQDFNRGLSDYKGYLGSAEVQALSEATRESMNLPAAQDNPISELLRTEQIFTLAKRCSLCQLQSGVLSLDCAHIFCRECIVAAITKQTELYNLVLMPDGQTIEELVCPVFSCFIHVSGVKLKEIIGQTEFEDRIEASVQILQKRQCGECLKVRNLSAFNRRCVCDFDICDSCYCNLYRENEKCCSNCCQPFSQGTAETLRLLHTDCGGCQKARSLISDFSHIECIDHIICQDCLCIAGKGNQRCPHCHRKFSWEELVEIQKFTEKICVFCNRKCRQSRINTVCGCVICYQCAKTKTIETGNSNKCFNCDASLSWEAHSALLVFIVPVPSNPSAREDVCLICNQLTDEATKVQLQCQHISHKQCLSNYLRGKVITGWFDSYIPCFKPYCTNTLHHSEVGYYLSSDDYLVYQGNITRARPIQCPNCTQLMFTQDANGLRLTHLICQQCRFHFCTVCERQYGADHDVRLCTFEKAQNALEQAERNSGPTDIVSQCPVCKTPLVKRDGGEDDVVCVKQECRVQFCVRCCVPTELYRYHGNAWHRPSCPRFVWSDRILAMNPNCKMCVELGRRCDPPVDLAVERRFGYNEK